MEEKRTGTERQGERWEGEEKKTVKGEEGQNEKQRGQEVEREKVKMGGGGAVGCWGGRNVLTYTILKGGVSRTGTRKLYFTGTVV